jgi:hypothetical protein
MRSPVDAVAFDASHHGEPLLIAHQRARQARGRADPEAACIPFAGGAGWHRGGVGVAGGPRFGGDGDVRAVRHCRRRAQMWG